MEGPLLDLTIAPVAHPFILEGWSIDDQGIEQSTACRDARGEGEADAMKDASRQYIPKPSEGI
jgi:hypothetical protein